MLFTEYNLKIVKDTGASDPVSPGDTIPYTVTVTNSGSTPLTDVSIYDPLPQGVSYVAGSGQVTAPITSCLSPTVSLLDSITKATIQAE